MNYRSLLHTFRQVAGYVSRPFRPFRKFLKSIYTWVGIACLLLGLSISLGGHYLVHQRLDLTELGKEFYANIGAELIGMAIAVLLIDSISRSVAKAQQKRMLVLQMGSTNNEVTKEATRILKIEGWIYDGSLRNANLEGANLSDVNLGYDHHGKRKVDLRRADLDHSKLNRANLAFADLTSVSLNGAKLGNTELPNADLSRASAVDADFRMANLAGADLAGANFRGADLSGTVWRGARPDERTVLPDGSEWHSGIDIGRFTDPSHSEFWRSTDPNSPAYDASRKVTSR